LQIQLLTAFYFFMLSDMSDGLSVKLYFSNGQIRYGEHGVDLSEFNSVDHVLKK
jgi:hypothetical protein